MNDLCHISRAQAIKLLKNDMLENTLLISISDTETEYKEIQQLFNSLNIKNNILVQLKFLDTIELDNYKDEYTEQIFNSVEHAIKNNMDIIVHCWAGISRSGAIAKIISDYYGLKTYIYERYSIHNRQLYDKIDTLFIEKFKNDKT